MTRAVLRLPGFVLLAVALAVLPFAIWLSNIGIGLSGRRP